MSNYILELNGFIDHFPLDTEVDCFRPDEMLKTAIEFTGWDGNPYGPHSHLREDGRHEVGLPITNNTTVRGWVTFPDIRIFDWPLDDPTPERRFNIFVGMLVATHRQNIAKYDDRPKLQGDSE